MPGVSLIENLRNINYMYDFQSISCLVKSGRARTIDYNWVFSSVTVVPKWLLNSTKLQNTTF